MIRTVADWLAQSASKANAALSGKKAPPSTVKSLAGSAKKSGLPVSETTAKKTGKKRGQKGKSGSSKKKTLVNRKSTSLVKKNTGSAAEAGTIDLTGTDLVSSGGSKKSKAVAVGVASAVKKGMSAAKRKELEAKIQELESVVLLASAISLFLLKGRL